VTSREKRLNYHRDYYARTKERQLAKQAEKYAANPLKYKDATLRRLYGITLEQHGAMLLTQNGACAICHSTTPDNNGGWNVDHCHITGAVRGLLCNGCNVGLGHFNDNPEALEAAAAYLRKPHEFIATN
jgi:hypothetical protein